MIDIHFHPLPGIDDGAADWEEAVELCRAAAEEGTEIVVATPHVLRDPWLNEDREARRALLAGLNERLGGRPRVLPGCEYWFTTDAVELVEQALDGKGPLEFLGGTKMLLVEFPQYFDPKPALDAFHEIHLLGVTPVIAHPELNPTLMGSGTYSVLAAFVERGAKAQVTAGILAGYGNRIAMGFAADLLEAGLAHTVASDAHHLVHRPPRMSAAREAVRRNLKLPEAVADALFQGFGIGNGPAGAGSGPDPES